MLLRIGLRLLLLALAAGGSVVAPTSLRGEAAKPPEASAPATDEPSQRSAAKGKGHLAPPAAVPEFITNLSGLPASLARTAKRLLAAARGADERLHADFLVHRRQGSGRLLEGELSRLRRHRGALDPDHDPGSRLRARR